MPILVAAKCRGGEDLLSVHHVLERIWSVLKDVQ